MKSKGSEWARRHAWRVMVVISLGFGCSSLKVREHGSDAAAGGEQADTAAAGTAATAGMPLPSAGAPGEGGDGANGTDACAGPAGEDGAETSDGCLASRVSAAAEAGLTADDVVTDVELLAGMTFTLPGLCEAVDSGCSLNDSHQEERSHTFHLRASSSGGLELVSSPRSYGEPTLEVKPLQPSGLGFAVSDLVTCATVCYSFEDEYDTHFQTTDALHLVFKHGEGSSTPTGMVVGLSTDDAPAVVEGTVDVMPPTLYARAEPGCGIDGDLYEPPRETRTFLFSEPVAGESDVVIEAGSVSEHVTAITRYGYHLGFVLQGVAATTTTLSTAVVDLAGNPATVSTPLRGMDIAPMDGDFESDVEFLDVLDFDSCWVDPDTRPFGSVVENFSVPALSGSHSFLQPAGAISYFRLTRFAGATQLKFDARMLGSLDGQVYLDIWSHLPVGGHVTPFRKPSWAQDEAFQEVVSTIEPFVFWLPEEGDDFLVSIHTSEGDLLIDSLRTE